jgi:pSer/pThr/pTyr-binding forkhead associated (FHA) protein
MECPNCHHWNEAGARFCEECGFELVAAADGGIAQAKVTGGVNPDPSAVPAPPADPADPGLPAPSPQDLIPNPDAVAASSIYTGARLVLEKTGTIFKLGDATLIGREEPAAQIDFDGYEDGKYISHRHAQITKTGGVYYLEDLGSTNATRVNGARLQQGQAQQLKTGDKIRFGKIELTFHES